MSILDVLRRKKEDRLIGVWRLLRSEESLGEDVQLEFRPNGRLNFSVREGDRRQIMLLTYRVSRAVLITDQPSAPREERSAYWFESGGILVLEWGGKKCWFETSNESFENGSGGEEETT